MSTTVEAVRQMFDGYRSLRAVIESHFDFDIGELTLSTDMLSARLDVGVYSFLGGAASDAGLALVGAIGDGAEIVLPDVQDWRDIVFQIQGRAVCGYPMRSFLAAGLDPARLGLAVRSADAEIVALDEALAAQLDDDLAPHALQAFEDIDGFLSVGFGFGALEDGQLGSAATTYTVSRGRAEVAISTRPGHRSRGLGRAVAAKLLAMCLDLGLTPEWTAANPISRRMALELGYRPGPLVDVVSVNRSQESQEDAGKNAEGDDKYVDR